MTQKQSFVEEALMTAEAKEAFIVGVVTLIKTGDFDAGRKAMIAKAKENGSLAVVVTAVVVDVLRWIWEILQGKQE